MVTPMLSPDPHTAHIERYREYHGAGADIVIDLRDERATDEMFDGWHREQQDEARRLGEQSLKVLSALSRTPGARRNGLSRSGG